MRRGSAFRPPPTALASPPQSEPPRGDPWPQPTKLRRRPRRRAPARRSRAGPRRDPLARPRKTTEPLAGASQLSPPCFNPNSRREGLAADRAATCAFPAAPVTIPSSLRLCRVAAGFILTAMTTIGLIGAGHIGSQVGRLAEAQ